MAYPNTSRTKKTLAANTSLQLVAPAPGLRGVRILNWTASPVYLGLGLVAGGDPPSTAPSDFVPAAASGVPGQYEAPYPPVQGLVGIGASAGDLSVETW